MRAHGFDRAYKEWLEGHKGKRTGERLRRLEEGHGFLERLFLRNIWWEAFGTLDGLHPEYEVKDFRDGYRYLDIACRPDRERIAIETDGYGPHVRDITVEKHADLLMRDTFLIADKWTVIHVSTQIIKYRPREIQLLLQQIVRSLSPRFDVELTLPEREVIRYARRVNRPVIPKEIADVLRSSSRLARHVLHQLVEKEIMQVSGGQQRARSFELLQPREWHWL